MPRSCGPVHHTTKVARHALHMPHTQHAHNTPKYIHTQIHMQHTDNTCHTHPHHTITPSDSAPSHNDHTITTRTATPASHLTHRVSITTTQNTSTKDRCRKQISLCLRKLLATVSSGHCQKKFAAVMAHMTSTVKTTNANFTISFETAIMIRSMSDKNRSLSLDIWHPLAMNRGLGVHWLGTTRASHIRDDTRKRGRDPTMKSEGTQPLLQRSGSIVRHSGIHC